MLKIKQAMNHSVNFCGVHVPMGAVYAIIPECTIMGDVMPKRYVWVENLNDAKSSPMFELCVFTRNDKKPRRYQVNGLYGYAQELRHFILDNVRDTRIHYGATTRDIHTLDVPRDRCVGRYTMRGVPSYDTAPRVMTENFVTNGCKINNRLTTDEGYLALRLGVKPQDFNGRGY